MKQAVIYARVSKQRDESVSIEAQIEQCRLRARSLGANVLQVFADDGISGQTDKHRPSFMRAKTFCLAGGVDYLITWSTSRFARNLVDLWRNSAELKEAGTRLECLNADVDDETDSGFISKVFHGAMDEMFTRQVARDTLRSQKKSAEQGFWTGGHMPYGYRGEKEGGRTRLQPCASDGPVVQTMFSLCLDGLGALAIADRLNERGLLMRGKRWAKNTVAYMLRNEIYTGVRIFNKTARKGRVVKPEAEWVRKDSHPALVSKEDFEKVQTMINDRTPHQSGGSHRSTFLFTGLLKCSACDSLLQITNGKNRSGTTYSYYSCLRHRRGDVRCLFAPVRADVLDDWLLGQILDKVLTLEVIETTVREIAARGKDWLQERATARAQLVNSMRELERARDKLYEVLEAHGKDAPDMGSIAERLRQRSAELHELQVRLAKLESAPAPSKLERIDPAIALEVMREVIAQGDTKKKRTLLGAFVRDITVSPARVTVHYRPEALLVPRTESVISAKTWLPDLGSNQGPTD